MRILIYSTAYYPLVGGAEVAIKEITDRLPNYQFDLICAKLNKKLPWVEKIGRVNVYRLGLGLGAIDKLYLAQFGHLRGLKLHQQKKYDLLWAVMASYGGFAAATFKLMAATKYLLTLQEGDFNLKTKRKIWLVRSKFKKIFSQADGLQAISNYLLNWGKAQGFKGELFEVVPNGVELALFTKEYSAEVISQIRESFGFPKEAIIIVSSSRLVPKNGLEYVIKALAKLPEKFCFYNCGDGYLKNRLHRLIQTLNLDKRAVLDNYKEHQELPQYLKAGHIFIRPSITEGLGNSFLEAMAAGLPIIGTLVGGIPDFLEDGVTGIVCQPKNPDSIAQAIKRTSLLSQAEKNQLQQNALKIIKERYNWEYISQRMDYLFNQLIK